MTKYEIARELLERAVSEGAPIGWDRDEMLLTMVVTAVEAYKNAAGGPAAVDALTYELGALGGNLDTGFMRSR